MIKIANVIGGKRADGGVYLGYHSATSESRMSEEGMYSILRVEAEHYVNAAFCKPGTQNKGVIAILTEDELKLLEEARKPMEATH